MPLCGDRFLYVCIFRSKNGAYNCEPERPKGSHHVQVAVYVRRNGVDRETFTFLRLQNEGPNR